MAQTKKDARIAVISNNISRLLDKAGIPWTDPERMDIACRVEESLSKLTFNELLDIRRVFESIEDNNGKIAL